MKRVITSAVVVAVSALLALGTTSSAYAADGKFIYTKPNKDIATLDNPIDGKCYNVDGVGHTFNDTDTYALLFHDAGCIGSHEEALNPHKQAIESEFKSVKFIA
ncbi:hypothetical protein ACWGIB_08525 [Streptomyces xiamenensis]